MVRIILEDIKINKKRDITPKKVESVFIDEPRLKKDIFEEIINETNTKKQLKNKFSVEKRIQRTPHLKSEANGFNKFILFFLILALITGSIYWGGNIFQKADITISSKHQLLTYKNKQFISLKESGGNTDDIMIMIYSDKISKDFILTEPKDVSIKSKGSITLYNEFSSTPQKLLAGTFISDNDGKTYKTDSVITIPGYKTDNKLIIPGQIVVDINAFLPGDAYNGKPTNFYITSFKGTSKYNKIYGKLKNEFIGGASGLVYTPNDSDISKINTIAQSSFKNDLLKKVQASVAPGYILYPNAMTFSYKISDNIFSKTPETKIDIEGVLSVVLFKEKSLVDNIIKVSLTEISASELKEIKILNLENLSFNFTNKDQLITKDMNSVSFDLSGDLDVVWNPDIEILKSQLIGVNKIDALSIFKQDPGISSAKVKIFPPWQNAIPEDLTKINIILK